MADKIPVFHSDITLPLEEAFSSGGELAKGCTFFIALVGTISAINGLTLLISGRAHGRAVLLFSGAVWLLWIGVRAALKIHQRARIAQPAGQIRLTSSEIAVLQLGKVESVRWMDLRQVRLTRDTAGTVYYEFYTDNEMPSIVLRRSRVKNPEALDRELQNELAKSSRPLNRSARLSSRLLFRGARATFHSASVLICSYLRQSARRCAVAGAFFSRWPSSSGSASRFRVSR